MKYKTIIIYGGSSEITPHLIDEFKNECEKIILFVRNNENQILKKIIDDDAEKKISYNVVDLSNLSMNLEILSKSHNLGLVKVRKKRSTRLFGRIEAREGKIINSSW